MKMLSLFLIVSNVRPTGINSKIAVLFIKVCSGYVEREKRGYRGGGIFLKLLALLFVPGC